MTIEVSRVTGDEFEVWNRCVDRSTETTPFHRSEVLRLLADHAGATLHALVGYKGEEPVGLLPCFELAKGPLTAAVSPPPTMWVPYLGPARLNATELSRRKAERRHRRFVEASCEYLEREIDPLLTKIQTGYGYDDPRPFQWQGHFATPGHTYLVRLTDEADLLDRFSSDARRNIEGTDGAGYVIERGGRDAVLAILDQVERRYRAQDKPVSLPTAFVAAMYDELPKGAVRPYVCRVDGEFVGGILALAGDDTVYRWFGGVKPDRDVDVPVNDLLDWRVMTDALAEGRAAYDLVGAGAADVNEYKAKFDPELETYYRIRSNAVLLNALSATYERVEQYKLAANDAPFSLPQRTRSVRNAVRSLFGAE